jgi:hypothetical protein
MTATPALADASTVRIVRAMNDHDAMCVEVEETNATRHVVDYENDDLRRTLGALPEGSSLPLRLEPLGDRANVWRAVESARSGRSAAVAPVSGGD